MDVVKTNIGKLGGVIDVASELGIGTKFTITLPITLAIISALDGAARGALFAIPLANVQEAVRARCGAAVRSSTGARCSRCAAPPSSCATWCACSACAPRTRALHRFCRLRCARTAAPAGTGGQRAKYVVVCAVGTRLGFGGGRPRRRAGRGAQGPRPVAQGVRGFAGATELGDQRIGLVLDALGLIEEVSTSLAERARALGVRRPWLIWSARSPRVQRAAHRASGSGAARGVPRVPPRRRRVRRARVLVREILKPPPLTEVPRAPHTVMGIISVRGQLVTVVDLRAPAPAGATAHAGARILLAEGARARDARAVRRRGAAGPSPGRGRDRAAAPALGGDVAEHIAGIARPRAEARPGEGRGGRVQAIVAALPGALTLSFDRRAAPPPRTPGTSPGPTPRVESAPASFIILLDLRAILGAPPQAGGAITP
jgi:hypothetical protein